MKKFHLAFAILFFSYHAIAQSPATTATGYFFATNSNYSLANMAGGIPVIGPGLENVATITFDMGFNFNFAGTDYNRFSVSSAGTMGLGITPVSPIFYEPGNTILNPFYTFPLFSPWSDELTTATNGGVSYKILTVNNLKKLVIEWRVRASTDEDTAHIYNKTFQVWLYEGSNRIQYVYGNSDVRAENSYIAIAKSISDYKVVNAGNHTIAMTSNNSWPGAGRTYIFSPVEIIPGALPIFLGEDGSTVNINCFGSVNGSITLGTISGGDGNYNINWNGPNGFTASGTTINNLGAGVYNFTITDGSGSEPITGARTITEPAMLAATVSTSQACAGTNNGNITVTSAVGGSGNYEFMLNNSNWQASGSFNALGAGSYTVQMRDASNISCIKTLGTQTVTEIALSATLTTTQACAGTNNGSISVSNTTGGSGNYEFSINNGNWQTTSIFNGLAAGTYSVQMRDAAYNSCIKNLDNQTITEYSLNATVTSTTACAGTSNGSISISNASGGSGNYEFSLNNGTWQSSGIFNSLAAGTYSVQMRDAAYNTCIKNLGNQPINEYSLNATVSSIAACAGTSNGSISIGNGNGGSGNYEFSLNNGTWQSSGLFPGLSVGTYSVQMRDATNAGCIKLLGNQTVAVFSLNATVSTSPACQGTNNGSINISNPTGGSGNYAYQLNNGNWQTAAIFTSLNAGTYTLHMRDANNTGCVKDFGNIIIAQAVAPAVAISANTPAFCSSVTLTASASNATSYVWSSGQTSASINLNNTNPDGTYTVVVANTNGCSGSASYQYVKQNILTNYTIVGLKTITLGESNTVNGSVGLTAAGQTTKIGKNSVINGFVKSPVISLMQPVTITGGSIIGVASITLPTMLINTAVTNNLPNLNIPDDYNGPAITYNINQLTIGKRAKVTLTGNIFGEITIKDAADVIFTASDISIDDLAAGNGTSLPLSPPPPPPPPHSPPPPPPGIDYLSISFNPNTIIRIKNTLQLGEKNLVNGFGATFYMGDANPDVEKITINGKNTIVNANTYMPEGTMSITVGPDQSSVCIMNGTHIDEIIKTDRNVTWSAFDCNAAPLGRGFMQPQIGIPALEIFSVAEQKPAPEQKTAIEKVNIPKQDIAVYPSPTTGIFILQLNTDVSRADIKIVNPAGLEIMQESHPNIVKGQEFKFDISKYPSGLYYIKVITGNGVNTKQIVKLK